MIYFINEKTRVRLSQSLSNTDLAVILSLIGPDASEKKINPRAGLCRSFGHNDLGVIYSQYFGASTFLYYRFMHGGQEYWTFSVSDGTYSYSSSLHRYTTLLEARIAVARLLLHSYRSDLNSYFPEMDWYDYIFPLSQTELGIYASDSENSSQEVEENVVEEELSECSVEDSSSQGEQESDEVTTVCPVTSLVPSVPEYPEFYSLDNALVSSQMDTQGIYSLFVIASHSLSRMPQSCLFHDKFSLDLAVYMQCLLEEISLIFSQPKYLVYPTALPDVVDPFTFTQQIASCCSALQSLSGHCLANFLSSAEGLYDRYFDICDDDYSHSLRISVLTSSLVSSAEYYSQFFVMLCSSSHFIADSPSYEQNHKVEIERSQVPSVSLGLVTRTLISVDSFPFLENFHMHSLPLLSRYWLNQPIQLFASSEFNAPSVLINNGVVISVDCVKLYPTIAEVNNVPVDLQRFVLEHGFDSYSSLLSSYLGGSSQDELLYPITCLQLLWMPTRKVDQVDFSHLTENEDTPFGIILMQILNMLLDRGAIFLPASSLSHDLLIPFSGSSSRYPCIVQEKVCTVPYIVYRYSIFDHHNLTQLIHSLENFCSTTPPPRLAHSSCQCRTCNGRDRCISGERVVLDCLCYSCSNGSYCHSRNIGFKHTGEAPATVQEIVDELLR